MAQKTRDALRTAILGGTHRLKRELLRLPASDGSEGIEVELRQPTIGALSRSAMQAEKDKVPPTVRTLIEYCYVPGTDDKVFEDADADVLSDLPTGAWLSKLNEVVGRLIEFNPKEAEKNSDATA